MSDWSVICKPPRMMGSVMADDEEAPLMDDYAPKGVHIWETEMHDFVVLYVVKGNAMCRRVSGGRRVRGLVTRKCSNLLEWKLSSAWNFPIRDNREVFLLPF